MNDEPQQRAVELVEHLFGILRDCRAIVRALEPNADRQESPSAAAERDLYNVLASAMEAGLVQTAEHRRLCACMGLPS